MTDRQFNFDFDKKYNLPLDLAPLSQQTKQRNQYSVPGTFPFKTWQTIPTLPVVLRNIALSTGTLFASAAGLLVTAFVFLPLGIIKTTGSLFVRRKQSGKRRRCVVINGASSGIGAALVEEYAAPDIHFVLIARNADRLHYMMERAQSAGATAEAHSLEFFNPENVSKLQQLLYHIDQEHAGIDIAINCTAVTAHRSDVLGRRSHEDADGMSGMPEVTGEEWGSTVASRMLQVNVNTAQTFILTAWELMKARRERPGGLDTPAPKIVLLASSAAFFYPANFVLYSASKAYLYALGQGLQTLSAPYGIEITNVCPGFIESGMTLTMLKDGATTPRVVLGNPRKLAKLIKRGEERNEKVVLYPFSQSWVLYAARALNPLLEVLGQWVGAATGTAAYTLT